MESKVRAMGIAGAGATVIFWILGYFLPEFMASAPVGAEAAVTALIGLLAGYMKTDVTQGSTLR